MRKQTYIVYFYTVKDGDYNDFFRFSFKKVSSVIKDIINAFCIPFYMDKIKKGKWSHIKIYRTPDGYHKENNPVVDMNITDFILLNSNLITIK